MDHLLLFHSFTRNCTTAMPPVLQDFVSSLIFHTHVWLLSSLNQFLQGHTGDAWDFNRFLDSAYPAELLRPASLGRSRYS